MAIAHQSEILGAANTAAGNYDTAITPAAAINGVVVVLVQGGLTSDLVTSVTYGTGAGAVPLTRRRFDAEPTEPGGVYIYWAGDSAVFPAGAQTVRVVRTGTTNLRAAISTMTCAAGQVVAVDSDATGQSVSAVPAWTHTSLTNNVVAYLGIHSGINAMTLAPATSWTGAPTPGFDDIGNFGRGWARRTLATAGALAPGWTTAADDYVGSSIAFKEAAVTQIVTDPVGPAVAGRMTNPGREAPTIFS